MFTDLAVLKIASRGCCPRCLWATPTSSGRASFVMAFGSPLGLANTVTMGVVSAVDRQLRSDDAMTYVQTDAPINPGNQRRPPGRRHGRGRRDQHHDPSPNRGRAKASGWPSPANTVKNVYRRAAANGIVRRGIIGVQPQTITPTLASGLSLEQSWGRHPGGGRPRRPCGRRRIGGWRCRCQSRWTYDL